jgi:hypothetical protein
MQTCLSNLAWRDQLTCSPGVGGSVTGGGLFTTCNNGLWFIAALVAAYLIGRNKKGQG